MRGEEEKSIQYCDLEHHFTILLYPTYPTIRD